MDKLDLSNFFTTKYEAQDFAERMSQIIERMYDAKFNVEQVFADILGIQKKDKFVELLRNNSIPLSDTSKLKQFMNDILEKISKIPVLTLTIAFNPTQETLASLSSWCTLNIGKQLVFDINVDPNLIGGAVILYEGKYYDFSIKPQFEKILEEVLNNKTTVAPAVSQNAPQNSQPERVAIVANT